MQSRNFKVRFSNITMKKIVFLVSANSFNEAIMKVAPLINRLGLKHYSTSKPKTFIRDYWLVPTKRLSYARLKKNDEFVLVQVIDLKKTCKRVS